MHVRMFIGQLILLHTVHTLKQGSLVSCIPIPTYVCTVRLSSVSLLDFVSFQTQAMPNHSQLPCMRWYLTQLVLFQCVEEVP